MARSGLHKPRDRLKSQQFEARVRAMLAEGLSTSAIATQMQASYRHTANIVARIKEEKR